MKVIQKTVILIILVCVSGLMLTGCGFKSSEENNTVTEPPVAEIRLQNYVTMCGNYSIKMTDKETNETVEGAVKGKNIAMKLPGTHGLTIKKGYLAYELDDRIKIYEKNPSTDELEKKLQFYDILKNMEDLTGKLLNSGDEEINGNNYYFEEYNAGEDRKVRFYFEGVNLKYVRIIETNQDEMYEILEITANPADTVFDVPADYVQTNE